MDRRTPKFESSNKPNPSNTLNTASKLKDLDQLLSNEMKGNEGYNFNMMQGVRRKLSYNQENNENSNQLFTFRQREEESEYSGENVSNENEPNAEILKEILNLNERIIEPSFDKSLAYKQHRDLLNKLKKFNFPERNVESELLKFVKYAGKTLTPQQQERMSEYYQLMNGPLLNITKYDELEEIKLMKLKEELLKKVYDSQDKIENLKKEKKMWLFQNELRLAEKMNEEFYAMVKRKIEMENENINLVEMIRKTERETFIFESEIKLKEELISKINKLLADNNIKIDILKKRTYDIKKLEEEIPNIKMENNHAIRSIEAAKKSNKILETKVKENEKLKDELAENAQKKEKESRSLQEQAEKKENENKNALELKKANIKKIIDQDHEIEITSAYNIEIASKKRQVHRIF